MQQYDHKAFVIHNERSFFPEELAEDCIPTGKNQHRDLKINAVQLDDVEPS